MIQSHMNLTTLDVNGCFPSGLLLLQRMKNGFADLVTNSTGSFGESMKSINNEIIKVDANKVPTLRQVLEFVGFIPDEGVFMGLALDKLPILLNVFAHEACNIVIWNKRAK
jgi:hypothetical protein